MLYQLLPPLLLLSSSALVAAVGKTDFTEACEITRLEMIANNQSLANEPRLQCGAQFSPLTPPSIPISTDLQTCLRRWPGWQISDPKILSQSIGPLVGFLLPALVFVLSIPRPPGFRMPRGERYLTGNIVVSMGWLAVIFILVVIDVLLWIIIVFGLAGPMMAGAMDEGIKDWRILRKVAGCGLSRQQSRYALTLILIGSFKPEPGDLNKRVIRDVCGADVSIAKDRFHQLLNQQGLYGTQVGAPVAFYLGAYAYALVDASSKLGDNDTAHAIAFGLWYGVIVLTATTCCAVLGMSSVPSVENVFGRPSTANPPDKSYETVWLWNRDRCVREWLDAATCQQALVSDDIRHILESRSNRFLAAFLTFASIATLCSHAITISYYTPSVGFGCRATTMLCYACCQCILILCWLYYNEDDKKRYIKWPVYVIGGLCGLCSVFTAIGGTVMQLLGVYRNCICKAGLRYWLNTAGGTVNLASDTQAHRDSGLLWGRFAEVGLVFIGIFCVLGWGYFMRMKAMLAKEIDKFQ